MSPRLCFCLLCVMIASISPSVAQYGPQTPMLDVAGIGAEISDRFEPKNDDIRKTAAEIAKDYPGIININQINEIHKILKNRWYPQYDPPDKELYNYANQTLRLGEVYGTIGGGDCDDFAILMSSLIEALGGATRVTFAWTPGEVGHVYAEVYLGNESDPHVDELLDWIKSEHGLSDIPGKTVTDGEVWLNLDWFADHPGGPYEKAENRAVVKDPPGTKRSPEIIPVIDAMEDVSAWEISRDDRGSSIEIKTVPGAKGNALEISYDLKEDGWVKITRDVDPKKLAGIEGLEFSYKSSGERNSIEFGMAYDDSTTFGVSCRPGVAAEWSSLEALYKNFVCVRPGDKCDLAGVFDQNKVRRLEFNISDNPDKGDVSGSGTLTIDQLQGIMFVPEGSPFAEVEKDRQKTIAIELAAKSEQVIDNDPTISILLAVESMRRYSTSQGDLALRHGLSLLAGHVATMAHNKKYWINDVEFSSDGEWVATASNDGTTKVWNAATGDLISIMTHDSQVHDVEFSPDGERVVTASDDDGTAKVWNVTTGELLATIIHKYGVNDVEFSPDGERVATASYDGTAKVWNATTSDLLATMIIEGGENAVEFSPHGERIATASRDGTAKVSNATTGDPIATMIHGDWVSEVEFSPDGERIATASRDGTAKVWNATTGDPIVTMTHGDEVNVAAFSPHGEWIATASRDGTAKIWNATTGDLIATLSHEDMVNDVEFSPDGEWVATASHDGTAKIWDATTGDLIATMTHEGPMEGPVLDVEFSPDGEWVATASHDGTAKVWNPVAIDPIATMTHGDWVSDVEFSPHGERVATASDDGTAKVWNAATGEPIATLAHEDSVYAVAFSPDGERVATASRDWTAKVWNAATGDPIATMTHGGLVYAVAFSPDGERVATASDDWTAKVWNATTGDPIATMAHEVEVNDVEFSPDGERVATASDDGTAKVWNASTGDPIATMTHEDFVNDVEFSPEGERVVTGSHDGTAKVWDASTGDPIATLTYENKILDVEFSPDGERIATASGIELCDGTANIWDAATGDMIATMAHEGPVLAVAFSSDGERVATASGDGTNRVWHWRPDDMIEDACSWVERGNLTEDEWNRYLPGEPYRVTCDLTN